MEHLIDRDTYTTKNLDYYCRFDYDVDGSLYPIDKEGIKSVYECENTELIRKVRQYNEILGGGGLYIIGYALYFELDNQKYKIVGGSFESWADNIDELKGLLWHLFKCDNFALKEGHLD